MSPLRPLAALIALSAVVSACGGSDSTDATVSVKPGAVGMSATTSAPATTVGTSPTTAATATTAATTAPSTSAQPATTVAESTTTTPTTAATVAPPPTDWDGIKWDLGRIVANPSTSAGITTIRFDRYSMLDDSGAPIAAVDLTKEPVVYANTDQPWENADARLRSYTLAPNARVVRLANATADAFCDPGVATEDTQPDWQPMAPAAFRAGGSAVTTAQTALTFNAEGQVTLVRLSYGC